MASLKKTEVVAGARGEPRVSMYPNTYRSVQTIVAAVAVLFGVVTLFAGGRVLLGLDPGYVVFRPLLIYNTAMGLAYCAAGVAVWRNLSAGRRAAGAIFLLNLLVLGGILVMYLGGGAVAFDSVRAMTLRTAVWLVLFFGASWLGRRQGERSGR